MMSKVGVFFRWIYAHCHRCFKLTMVLSRLNTIQQLMGRVNKTDLCDDCTPKEWDDDKS